MTKADKKVQEWRIGDTIKVKDKEKIVDGKIESIDKVITVDEVKRQWATVLVHAVLGIENCRHNILRGRLVNLFEYKLPEARKPVVEPKDTKHKAASSAHGAPVSTHRETPTESRAMRFKCCGHPSTMGHAEDCLLKEGK